MIWTARASEKYFSNFTLHYMGERCSFSPILSHLCCLQQLHFWHCSLSSISQTPRLRMLVLLVFSLSYRPSLLETHTSIAKFANTAPTKRKSLLVVSIKNNSSSVEAEDWGGILGPSAVFVCPCDCVSGSIDQSLVRSLIQFFAAQAQLLCDSMFNE